MLCREHRAYYVGFDRRGHPVYLEYFGATQWLKVLQHVSADEVVRAHVQQMEITHRLLYRAASGRAGRPVQRQVNILDMRGLAVGSLTGKAMELTGRIAKIDQDHYPETLEACYIINPPWAFSAAFNLVTRFLDEKTRKKVQVLPSGPDLHARLKQLLGPDAHIPAAAVSGTGIPDFNSVDFPAKGLLGAHEIVYQYVAERERAIATGEAVDGPRHLANSKSYSQLASLGLTMTGATAAPPVPPQQQPYAVPATPPPLPARRASQAQQQHIEPSSPWSTRTGPAGQTAAGPSAPVPSAFAQSGSFRSNGGDDAYSSDNDGPGSVFYDAEDDERVGLTNSAWAAIWAPGSTGSGGSGTSSSQGVAAASGPASGPHWERDRGLSVKLLAQQPEAFRHAVEAEQHSIHGGAPGSAAGGGMHLPGTVLPRGRELLSVSPEGEEDDSGFREDTGGTCCFCFRKSRR